MHFEPDFRHMLAVMRNERPARLPIYEHHISPVIMEQVLDVQMVELLSGTTTIWTSITGSSVTSSRR